MTTIATSYKVRIPLTQKPTYRRKVVNFGDGYEQRSKEGINFLKEEWDVTFVDLTATQKETLKNLINTAAGCTPITWLAPGDAIAKQWIFLISSVQCFNAFYWEITCSASLVNEP